MPALPRTFYLLLHKPSGKIMPSLGQGSTYWEPDLPPSHARDNSEALPRLFRSPGDAKRCAQFWELGTFHYDKKGYPKLGQLCPSRRSTLEILPCHILVEESSK